MLQEPRSSDAVPRVDPTRTYGASFHGDGWELFLIGIQCGILTMLTFGLYAPWARVRQLKFLTDNAAIAGTPLDYKGTGREILKGYFIGVVFFTLFYVGCVFLVELAATLTLGWLMLLVWGVLSLWLGHYAYYRTRRYRFSRTTWREIRFRLTGSAAQFATLSCRNLFLAVVTLGILFPWYLHGVQSHVYGRLHFGSLPFQYTGNRAEYTSLWLRGFLRTVLTLGIYYFWWQPQVYTYFVEHLEVASLRFTTRIRPKDYFVLVAGNTCMVLLTLGVAAPWAMCRSAKFYCERLHLVGALDLEQAVQAMEDRSAGFAEGIADALDVDVDVGF